MGPTPSKASEGIITVSHGRDQQAPDAVELDPILVHLRHLAQELPRGVGGAGSSASTSKDAVLQEELHLSALVAEASQALAADVSRPLTEYQAWSAARLRHAASKQLLVHMKLEEAASKAEEASEHVGRLLRTASGVNAQLDTLDKLPQQVAGLCEQLRALQKQCEALQSRAASARRTLT